ncbi:MAG: hypothetical protein ACP5HQ_04075 [Thermoprotei archaeon]
MITKRVLLSPYALFWGVAFTYFWIFMGAFVMSANVPKVAAVYYTAAWFGTVLLLSSSSFAVSMSYMLAFQTGGLPYLMRFSKLTPRYYLASLYAASLLVTLVVAAVTTPGVILLFSYHFGEVITPASWGLAILSATLAGAFYIPFVLLIEELTLKLSPKVQTAIPFVPLMLSYLSAFTYINLEVGYAVYLDPFMAIDALAVQSFLTNRMPLNYASLTTPKYFLLGGTSRGPYFDPALAIASVLAWVAVLSLASMALFRRLYYRSPEEARYL